jgi:D-alanyl-lipoteichoic acid acyltransferase DltB (MBOAT superfamily)
VEITSLSFVAFVAAVAIAVDLAPSQTLRSSLLTSANFIFLATYISELQQIVPALVFLLLGYVIIQLVGRWRSGIITLIGIGLVLVIYVYLKKFSFLDYIYPLKFTYLVVGLSYILFRIVHLIIDVQSGDIAERIKPLMFFNYTCNFLTFISGPIQSYQEFARTFNELLKTVPDRLSDIYVFGAFRRITSGYIKIIVISGIANYLYLYVNQRIFAGDLALEGRYLIVEYGYCSVMYTTYLYFNFSGYMDIVIGVGRLLGQDLPENFNKPFLARNFLEFWTRWHMTLSQWFKTYLFNPLMSMLISRVPQAVMIPYLGIMAFFITFFVMGVWHGTTIVFVIYGLLMGAGASANKLWQLVMVDRLGREGYRRLSEQPLYIYSSRGLTTGFFAMGVTCLWVNMDQLHRLWDALGLAGLSSALLLSATACGIAMFLHDLLLLEAKKWFPWAAILSQRNVFGNFWCAAQILVIFTVSTFLHKTPEFVYRAF